MEKFTKGPWRIEEFRDFTSIMAGDSEICYMDDDLNRYENARLIAAAPEMYELLGRIQDYLQTLVFDDIDQQFINEIWIDEIRMEMNKARGEE